METTALNYGQERQLALIAVKDKILEHRRTIEYLEFKARMFKGMKDPWIDIDTGTSARLSFLMFRESPDLRNMQAANDQKKALYMDKYWQEGRQMLRLYKKHGRMRKLHRLRRYLKSYENYSHAEHAARKAAYERPPAEKQEATQARLQGTPQDRLLFLVKEEIKENMRRSAAIIFLALPFAGMAAVVSHIFL